MVLTARQLSEADRSRLNGNVSRVMQKGDAGAADLMRWLRTQTEHARAVT